MAILLSFRVIALIMFQSQVLGGCHVITPSILSYLIMIQSEIRYQHCFGYMTILYRYSCSWVD